MPDGTVISGVPSNITKAELGKRYQAYQAKSKPKPEPSFSFRPLGMPGTPEIKVKARTLTESIPYVGGALGGMVGGIPGAAAGAGLGKLAEEQVEERTGMTERPKTAGAEAKGLAGTSITAGALPEAGGQ